MALRRLAPLGAAADAARAVALGPLAGRVALAVLVLGAFAVVAVRDATGTACSCRAAGMGFPHWESGPLHTCSAR